MGCLHTAIGSVLAYHGFDPLLTLGASWDFYYRPDELFHAEYYYPLRRPGLVETLAPFHPVSSTWREPPDDRAAWEEVRAWIAGGEPAVVAVDNFFVPFRPAFGDVHSAHLVVVYGFDDEAGTVDVLDAVPPAFDGRIPLNDLCRARSSGNAQAHERDRFFAGTPIERRWLEIRFHGERPELSREWFANVMATNLRGFGAPYDGPGYSGLDGLRAYLGALLARVEAGDREALEELFAVGGTVLDNTGLHGDFLGEAGRRLRLHRVVEVGRRVDRLAHHLTAMRIHAAKGQDDPRAMLPRLVRRVDAYLADHRAVLDEMEALLRDLPVSPPSVLPA